MSAGRPAPFQIGQKIQIGFAGQENSTTDVELLGFGEVPSPYVLVLRPWGEETVVFTGPGVTLTATPHQS